MRTGENRLLATRHGALVALVALLNVLPAIALAQAPADPVLSPDAVPPQPALAPSDIPAPRVLSPDAVRPEPVLRPGDTPGAPALPPN